MAGFAIRLLRLIEEHISGSVATSERLGFIRLCDHMENGCVLIVTRLDRLGRNAMDIKKRLSDWLPQIFVFNALYSEVLI